MRDTRIWRVRVRERERERERVDICITGRSRKRILKPCYGVYI